MKKYLPILGTIASTIILAILILIRKPWPGWHEVIFGILAIATFWAGVGSFIGRKPKDEEDADAGISSIVGTCLLIWSEVCAIAFIADYFLPRPMRWEGDGIMVSFIVGWIVFGLQYAAYSFFTIGNKGSRRWIPTLLYGGFGILAIGMFVLTLNNTIYSGCEPTAPIGTKCPCEDTGSRSLFQAEIEYNDSLPSDTVNVAFAPSNSDTSAVSPVTEQVTSDEELVIIPKGGSLCGTLHMTGKEALQYAEENGVKHWTKNGVLYVMVYPGDTFIKTTSGWEKK
jgi:hypothetical protein